MPRGLTPAEVVQQIRDALPDNPALAEQLVAMYLDPNRRDELRRAVETEYRVLKKLGLIGDA